MYKTDVLSPKLLPQFGDKALAKIIGNSISTTPRLTHEIVHELGSDLGDSHAEKLVTVDPSPFPTKLHIKSTVRAVGARALRSAPYLASVRRRESRKIANLIAVLHAKPTILDDFVVWTHEPLDRIRSLLDTLSTAEQFRETEYEGNSCEILRQLRDTFLNLGWQSYLKEDVCAAAKSVLSKLATEDEITSEDVYASLDTLIDAGLSPSIGIPIDDDDEEEAIPD